jgi:hypothetical protein
MQERFNDASSLHQVSIEVAPLSMHPVHSAGGLECPGLQDFVGFHWV